MQKIDGLLCDLDGVIYRGVEPIPGAAEKIAELRASGVKIVFATNNATATVERYRQRLSTIGVDTARDEILTSAVVTAETVTERGWNDLPTFLIGRDGIREELTNAGVRFVEGSDARRAELVVSSGDWNLTYDRLRTACFALRAGAHFIATNGDPTFPAADGLWPGAGAILAAVETASGRSAEVMGKPHRPMMEAAARRLTGCAHIAVIGDQPLTDLAGAHAMGWTAILVLTGVTSSADRLEPRPDLVIDSLADLPLPA